MSQISRPHLIRIKVNVNTKLDSTNNTTRHTISTLSSIIITLNRSNSIRKVFLSNLYSSKVSQTTKCRTNLHHIRPRINNQLHHNFRTRILAPAVDTDLNLLISRLSRNRRISKYRTRKRRVLLD